MLTAIIFIILAIIIKYRKIYWLFAGYNTMQKEEKEKYDIEGITIEFRNVMFGMAVIIIVCYFIADMTESPNIEIYAFWTSMAIEMLYLLIKSKSKKKIKNKYEFAI